MIRQTDNIRVTERCYEPTYYIQDGLRAGKKDTCEYLEKGKCVLNACIKVVEHGKKA